MPPSFVLNFQIHVSDMILGMICVFVSCTFWEDFEIFFLILCYLTFLGGIKCVSNRLKLLKKVFETEATVF